MFTKSSSHTISRMNGLLVLLVAFVSLPAAVIAAPPPTHGVNLRPIGKPTWMPVDFHLFSAPVGTAETEYREALQTVSTLLPPPNHKFHPALGIGPGDAHAPPYNYELSTGVSSQGFKEGTQFDSTKFSNGMGVWMVWMNVPAPGTTGSSPDFASGPIIPNTLFPIHVEGAATHNNKPFSFLAAFDVPALDASLDPPFTVDGHSHFPIYIADNADFGPQGTKLSGTYSWNISMVDSSGSGWQIEAHFAVGP